MKYKLYTQKYKIEFQVEISKSDYWYSLLLISDIAIY